MEPPGCDANISEVLFCYTLHMAFSGFARRVMGFVAGAFVAMTTACGGQPAPIANPLQSQLPTPTPPPTSVPPPPAPTTPATTMPATARPAQAATQPVVIATPNQKSSSTIILTPGFQGTSQAVILTITAQYFSPTPPATPTKRPGSIGVGAGAGSPVATSTPVSGVVIATLSERVSAGGAASLEIRSAADVLCTISQKQNEFWQPVPGLPARVTGSDGSAAWVWNLDPAILAGPLELFVDCGAGRNAIVKIQVEK